MALAGKRVKVRPVRFVGIPGDVERCSTCT